MLLQSKLHKNIMSKINLEVPFNSFRGKVCKHSEIIFKKMNGRLFTSKICNPHTGEPSEAQKEVRTKLIQAIQAAKAISAEQLTNYKNEFKKQKKYVSLWGFIVAKEYAKL